MINVLIADDYPLIRKGMKHILSEASDMYVTDEACTGQEVLEKTSEKHYDIVLLDITLPDMNGLGLLKELKTRDPALPVLIISMHSEEKYALSAFKYGASGYLNKRTAADELLNAIKQVTCGKKWITPAIEDNLLYPLDFCDMKVPHQSLTNREMQVLCMIASGNSAKEIAGLLFLSDKTVFCYRDRISKKLRLKNTSEIIRYAIRHDLVCIE